MGLARSSLPPSSSKPTIETCVHSAFTDAMVVDRYSETYNDARFYKLDVDEVPEVAQELSVRAMPTFMLFKDGEKVGEVVGANPSALETAIKNHS